MAPADAHAWYAWLPMWNTIILLSFERDGACGAYGNSGGRSRKI